MQKLELIDSQHKTSANYVACILIDKPAQANALDQELMTTLTRDILSLHHDKNCRGLILAGKGKHFCAGAHLKWMQDSAKLNATDNIAEAKRLTDLYESIDQAPFPTMAFVRGAAYGGGVGLAAACNIVIANEDAKFCLSEVKLGLIPAVILPYVQRRLTYGSLHRYGLSAKIITAEEATHCGLAEIQTTLDHAIDTIAAEWNLLLQGGPHAQAQLKLLMSELRQHHLQQSPQTAQAIAKIRAGDEAKSGLEAFFQKKTTTWLLTLKQPEQLRSLIE